MAPETSRSETQTDTVRKNDTPETRAEKKDQGKTNPDSHDIGVRPSDAEQKNATDAVLERLNLKTEFSKLLSAEEMQSLRISVDRGNTLETDPPQHVDSIGVSFVRNGKRVTMEQGIRWQGERSKGDGAIFLEKSSPVENENPATDVLKGVPAAEVTSALLKIAARIGGNELGEKQENLEDILSGEQDNTLEKGQRGTKELKDVMDKMIKNVDGAEVLRKAAATLPSMDAEVYEKAMKGPPPVAEKPLGTMVVKSSVVIEEIGNHIREKYKDKKNTDTIVNAIVDAMANPEFILASLVRFTIEKGEQTREPTDAETGLSSKDLAYARELSKRFDAAVDPEESGAEKQFITNAVGYVKKGKAEGRTFITAQERREQAEGNGYMVEKITSKAFETLGVYREAEDLGRNDAVPVTLAFEKSTSKETPKPTLKLTAKPGKDTRALSDALTRVLGNRRMEQKNDVWEIKELSMREMFSVVKILRNIAAQIDPMENVF